MLAWAVRKKRKCPRFELFILIRSFVTFSPFGKSFFRRLLLYKANSFKVLVLCVSVGSVKVFAIALKDISFIKQVYIVKAGVLYPMCYTKKSKNSILLKHLLIFFETSCSSIYKCVQVPSTSQTLNTAKNTICCASLRATLQLLPQIQVTLQCVEAVWSCVMAGMFIGSLGILPSQ